MGDIEGSFVHFFCDFLDGGQNLNLSGDIQSGRGLIKDYNIGFTGHGHGHHGALELSP